MKTKAAILVEPRRFEIREKELEMQADEVLIKIQVCGLCNWELNHFKGILGEYPMSLGHEWAGIIVDKGSEVNSFQIGDRVAVLPDSLEGFAEFGVTKAQNCFLVGEGVDLKNVLLEPLKCVVTVLRAAAPEPGDYGVVVGCGPMGLWCIQALEDKTMAGVIAVDVDEKKLDLAKKFGASYVINGKKCDVKEKIKSITQGHMADFVIEGTGRTEMLEQAAAYLKTGRGRLVLMSYYDRKAEGFDFRLFSDLSLQLLNPHPSYSLNPLDDARRAMALVNKGTFSQKDIITHKFGLEEIQKAFEIMENKPDNYVKGVIEMGW